MNLKFTRKLGKSAANDAFQISIPRVIAQGWAAAHYDEIEMVFDPVHNVLVIAPK